VAAAASSGARDIDTVVVACIDATDVDGAYPCGRCRQIMSEFDVKRVVVTGGEGSEVREHTLDELLPYRFSL
jgi:cytidine deaminase